MTLPAYGVWEDIGEDAPCTDCDIFAQIFRSQINGQIYKTLQKWPFYEFLKMIKKIFTATCAIIVLPPQSGSETATLIENVKEHHHGKGNQRQSLSRSHP